MSKPKVLVFDIETSPIISYTWALFDQNIGLNQIVQDWNVLSWSAKWLESEDETVVYGPHRKIMYEDLRASRDVHNDKNLLKGIRKLLDEADVVITQNGVAFDSKKLNARFLLNKIPKPSSYKHIDTLKIAKSVFKFTSNKLEYMTDKLCTKYKKITKRKYAGFELWKECLKGNLDAWKEMEVYNKHDVLSLEELYYKLIPWDTTSVNFNLYHDGIETVCKCGSRDYKRNGYAYTSTGKFTRYKCLSCGSETRDRKNLLTPEKKEFLKVNSK